MQNSNLIKLEMFLEDPQPYFIWWGEGQIQFMTGKENVLLTCTFSDFQC